MKKLLRAKVRVETVHFHLRTNISSVAVYERAIAEVAEICRAAKFSPLHLDIGGGLPVRHVLTRGGKVFDGEFGLRSFAQNAAAVGETISRPARNLAGKRTFRSAPAAACWW